MARAEHRRESVPPLGYQPALDGLRAIAVGLVLLYHGGVGWASGGYLGVDVFFVLSGFLITWLLVDERTHHGRIRIGAFYGRRARRLFPAIVLVLVAVAGYAVTIAPRGDLAGLRGDILATFGYSMNWRLIAEDRGYFDSFGTPSPLTHAWSLAIEEQWYLVWPLLLSALLAVARGRRRLTAAAVATAVLMLLSAGWAAALTTPGTDPSRAYYGTDARVQELLAGALLALVATRGHGLVARTGLTARLADVTGVAGLAWLLWLSATIDSTVSWLFEGGMLAVAGAVWLVVIAVQQPTSVLRRALSWRPLVWVGLLSYGLYLWHYPVYVVLTPERSGLHGGMLLAARLAATASVAVASYRLVERPIRAGSWSTRRWVSAATASLALAALALAVVVPVPRSSPPSSLLGASEPAPTDDPAGDPSPTAPEVRARLTEYVAAPPPSTSPDDRSTRVLATGDSVALTLSMRFDQRIDHPVTLWDTTFFGCPLFPSARRPVTSPLSDREQCGPWRADRSRWIQEFDPDVVTLLAGVWEMYDKEVDGRVLEFGSPDFDRWFATHLDELIDQLGAGGAAVVVLGPPCNRRPSDITGAEPVENQSDRLHHLTDLYRAAAARSGDRVSFIDLNGFVCPEGSFLKEKDGVQLREDDGVHFTPDGAQLVRDWLFPQLVRLGQSSPRSSRAGG